MSYLLQIATAVPENCFSQDLLAEFYSNTTDDASLKRKIKIVAAKSGIKSRYSVLKDFDKNPSEYQFFNPSRDLLPEPSLTRRMAIYKEQATALSLKAIAGLNDFDTIKSSFTHLITVTCTGLFAPGLDIELIRALSLNPNIHRSSVNFMGCNAAVLALKQADAICNSFPNAKVLVVCTELCTIHFQKKYNDDYLLSNLLFADGAAAVILGSRPADSHGVSVKLNDFHSSILHNGYSDMAWQLSETGFIMNLSSYVPSLIKENIKEMLDAISVAPEQFKYWAVHPGGKKILDDFAKAMGLQDDKLANAYDVLQKYGNMSSPTVLFVLKQIIDRATPQDRHEKIMLAAFGPGISIETLQLQYV